MFPSRTLRRLRLRASARHPLSLLVLPPLIAVPFASDPPHIVHSSHPLSMSEIVQPSRLETISARSSIFFPAALRNGNRDRRCGFWVLFLSGAPSIARKRGTDSFFCVVSTRQGFDSNLVQQIRGREAPVRARAHVRQRVGVSHFALTLGLTPTTTELSAVRSSHVGRRSSIQSPGRLPLAGARRRQPDPNHSHPTRSYVQPLRRSDVNAPGSPECAAD